MLRRLLAITALGLGLLSTGLPALARAPRPEVEWKAIEDSSGREIPDDQLHGTVRLRGHISAPNGVEAWKVEVAPVEGAAYDGFGTICRGAVQGGGDETVEIDCDWETAAYPDGVPSTNDSYRLRVSARSDGDDSRIGPDRQVTLANTASEPRDVRLAYDKTDRRVSLRWSANPEPDLIHYVVEERMRSKAWKTVGEPPATSWDQVMTEPGTYRYQVSAVRRVGDKGRTKPGPSARPESPSKVVVGRTAPGAPAPPADQNQNQNQNPSSAEEAPAGAASAKPEAETKPAPDMPPSPRSVVRAPGRSPSLDLLRGTAAPDLRQPPSRRAVRPRPKPAPAAAAPEPDPGYSLTLPYPRRESAQRAPEPPRLQPAASGTRSGREARGRNNLPLALAVLAASFLGLMSGLLHLGRSSVASRRRLPAPSETLAPAGAVAEEAGVTPLEERLWWLGVQWRHADTATRLELMGDVLDIQLELVARLGAAAGNWSFGDGPILSPVA